MPQAWHDLGRAGLSSLSVVWTAPSSCSPAAAGTRVAARRRVERPCSLPAAAAHGALRGRRPARPRARLSVQRPTDRALWAGADRRARAGGRRGRAGRACARGARAPRSPGWSSTSAQSPPPGGLARPAGGRARRPLAASCCTAATTSPAGSTDGRRRPAELPPTRGRQVTRVRGGRPRALGRRAPPAVCSRTRRIAAELADAARLALEHERLRRDPARAARRACVRRAGGIVATADAERRSLERDLHDGAQQRLATLAIAIRLARRQLAPTTRRSMRELAAAEERAARVALAELRELAHGLIPDGACPRGPRAGGRGARRAVAPARRRRAA